MRRLWLILLFVALAFAYAWSRIRVIELGYQVSKLRTEVEELHRRNGVLKSEVAKALATVNLSDWSSKLGLSMPQADQVLLMEDVK